MNKSVSYNTGDWQNGLLKETSIIKRYGPVDPATNQRPYSLVMAKTKYFWAEGEARFGNRRNPVLQKVEVTNDAGQTKATEYRYDQYNNQTMVIEYDFAAAGSLGTLLRQTNIGYERGETNAGWINANLLGLVKSVEIVAGGVPVSKTLYEYDNNGNDTNIIRRYDIDINTHSTFYNPDKLPRTERFCPNGTSTDIQGDAAQGSDGDGCITIYHPGYSAASAYRGNVTKIAGLINVYATSAESDLNADVSVRKYDIAGNLVSATLSCCNEKTIDYGASFAETGYAYPVKETKGTSPQLTYLATYNRNTGLVTSSTDENGQVTNYEYEPDTLRQRKVTYPNGGYTLTEYSDKLAPYQPLPGFVRTQTTLDANKTAQSYAYFDGRGAATRNATWTPNGWLVSAIEYDALGRARKSYNPFYAGTAGEAIPAGAKHTELTGWDALGRTTQVRLQDNTTVSTAFNGTTVTMTDQAGKQRRQVADALGRTARVDEPDTNGNLTQPTDYQYDGNDNLSKVIQSGDGATQERRFKYDSLSRLTHERQVEATATLNDSGTVVGAGSGQWTKVLKYDNHSLLTDGWDARGVKTTFSYDGLNRVQNVTFSDDTPAVTYTYDQARSGYFNKGALTRVETKLNPANPRPNTPTTATEFDYDLMGRVKAHRQTIDTQTFYLGYGYNLAGQLTSETYPSGKVVSMDYDIAGRLTSLADNLRTYVSAVGYQGTGGNVNSMTLGNGTGEGFAYNHRLQLTTQTLTKPGEILQQYDYGYGQIDQNGDLDTSKNNGQLARVESTIGTIKQFTQKFSYDSVGRLSESKEYRGDNTLTYQQKFDFDRFGNLYRKQASNPNSLAFTPIEDGDISKSTNRFTSNTTYDDAGNVTQDNKFRNLSYSYDANGRMFKTSTAQNNQSNSVYDASGNRVATKVENVWTYFVYDAFGKMVAEYGGLSSTSGSGVKYVHSDWQGSTRTVTGADGLVKARMDYTAFGEEINSGVGQRTTTQGFNANNNLSQKYALTERDKATGLDHTWWRKNENKAGRWTSPDPYNGSMSLGDPQSFNRYAYVGNDPTNFVDPSGLNAIGGSSIIICRTYDRGSVDLNTGVVTISERTECQVIGGGGGISTNINPREPIGRGGGGGGRSNGSGVAQTENCGVNPINANPGFSRDPKGVAGNLRPGVEGQGYFGARRDGGKRRHQGLDISGVSGESNIYAFYGGVVKLITGSANSTSGYGLTVTVDHGNGYTSLYSHLSSTTQRLKVRDRVGSGSLISMIGTVGQSGNANGQDASEAHVHFEIRKNGKVQNPENFLNSPCPKDFPGRVASR